MRTEQVIQAFLDSCRSRNISPTSIVWYRDKLDRFARSCPELCQDINPIESFLAGLEGSGERKQNHFRALRAFYNFASTRCGSGNPMLGMKAPHCRSKVMATLEPDQALSFLVSATTLRDKALLTFLIDTGVRTGELAVLRQHDIKTSTVVVYGKCGQREVPVSEETRRLLLALIAQQGPNEYVFLGRDNRPLSRNAIYRIVRRHMARAGITGPKLGAHRIRHTFGKTYLVAGGDLRSLQQIMGHAKITTTEKYASLNLTDCINKHHQFTPLKLIQGAAQTSFFSEAVRQAEEVIAKR